MAFNSNAPSNSPTGYNALHGFIRPPQPYSPPQSGGLKAASPVRTANDAQNDFSQKLKYLQDLSDHIKAQSDVRANQAVAIEQARAQADLVQSEMKMKQQGLDIQKAKSDADIAIASSRNKALSLINPPESSTTPSPASPTPSTSPTTPVVPTPNTPVASPTPAPSIGTRSTPGSTANQGITTATDTYTSSLQDIQQAKDTLASRTTRQLDSLLSGTIPLSQPQQALVTSLQNQLATNESYQKVANEAFVGQVSEAAFRAGGEYTPAEMAGEIHNAISTGVAKIQDLDNKAASTIADMENKFETQNYDLINKGYDVLMKQLDDKASLIKNTYDTTVSSLKDMRDYDLNLQKFQEQKFNDEIDRAQKAEQLAQGRYEYRDKKDIFGNAIGTEVYDKQTGKPVGSYGVAGMGGVEGTGADAMGLKFNVQTNSKGQQYLDSSGLSGKDLLVAQGYANQNNIALVGKDEAADLRNIDTARANQEAIGKQVLGLLPKDANGRLLGGAIANKLGQFFQTDDQLAGFNSWRSAAINTLKATAGSKGLRINQAEIDMALKNDIPNLTDTVGTALQKLQNIDTLLNNAEAPALRSSSTSVGKTYTFKDPKTGSMWQGSSSDDLKEAKSKGYLLISQ